MFEICNTKLDFQYKQIFWFTFKQYCVKNYKLIKLQHLSKTVFKKSY